MRSKNRDKTAGKAIECKFCGSLEIVRHGRKGDLQVYLCHECGHTFQANRRFPRMRTDPEIIATALGLYFDGLSFEKVRRHLKAQRGVHVSSVAIWKWAVKFSELVDAMVSDFKPGSSGIWEADETKLKVRGRWKWLWDAIDSKTRYVVATHISTGRDIGQALKFLRETERRNERPRIITTDGLQSYNGAIKKAYWSKHLDRRVTHDRSPGLKAGNKNKIERFHSTLKGKYHAMRGLKNTETGHTLLRGFIIQYNYLRPHEALDGLTPAEASGIKLPFEDGWGDLINWATIHQTRRTWPPEETGEASDN